MMTSAIVFPNSRRSGRPSGRRVRSLLQQGLLAISAALLLPGCASTGAGSSSEPKTDSDRTDADRRSSVRIELATGYFTRGQYETALDEIKQALVLKPDLREAINLRNLVYAAMGETAMAEEGFKRALNSAPSDGDAMHNYAWFLCQQGRWTPSRALFDQALALPNYRGMARTLLARGVCEARNGEWPAAERSLSKAFELEPGNPAVALNLAEVLYRQQQYERARFYVRRINTQADFVNAQSLWLELRIERRLNNGVAVDDLSQQLRRRFSDAAETQRLRDGRFDD